MSRLQQYINEEKTKDLQYLINMVKSDCKPFLREMKKAGQFLYRGYDNVEYSTTEVVYYKKKVRSDRKPRDMYQNVHNKMDKLFDEKFGWKARSNGIFCTGDRTTALGYGTAFMVFPIGNFKFIWSPEVEDLWRWVRGHISSRKGKSTVPDLEGISETYTNKDFPKAIKSGNEIIINCKEYYMLCYYNVVGNVDNMRDFFNDITN
jgi:hypothetical protein